MGFSAPPSAANTAVGVAACVPLALLAVGSNVAVCTLVHDRHARRGPFGLEIALAETARSPSRMTVLGSIAAFRSPPVAEARPTCGRWVCAGKNPL